MPIDTTLAALLPDASNLSSHIWWYLGRSSGFVAYWLLFSSVAMGLAISSRIFDGMLARPWVFEFHKFLSLLVMLVMVVHGLIMLPDPYAGFTLRDLLVPFYADYRGPAMATGIITLYGSVFISATFYMKGMIGQKGWRLIHYTSFSLFLGAMAHGVWIGTETKLPAVQISYLASGVMVLFLTFFRILAARSAVARDKKAAPTRVVAEAA